MTERLCRGLGCGALLCLLVQLSCSLLRIFHGHGDFFSFSFFSVTRPFEIDALCLRGRRDRSTLWAGRHGGEHQCVGAYPSAQQARDRQRPEGGMARAAGHDHRAFGAQPAPGHNTICL